jgi:hypothetical protein
VESKVEVGMLLILILSWRREQEVVGFAGFDFGIAGVAVRFWFVCGGRDQPSKIDRANSDTTSITIIAKL